MNRNSESAPATALLPQPRLWGKRENVTANHGGSRKQVSSTSYLNFEAAEELTGIKQPQVSKWAKRLSKREEYRAALYGVAYSLTAGSRQ